MYEIDKVQMGVLLFWIQPDKKQEAFAVAKASWRDQESNER